MATWRERRDWPMNTDGNNDGWDIFEERSYALAADQCGGLEYVDRVTAQVDYALSRNPTGFQKIPGYQDLYLVKTRLRITPQEVVPAFRIWFRVDRENRRVLKEHVEMTPPEELGFAEDPFDP
jgi:hypothetical protein